MIEFYTIGLDFGTSSVKAVLLSSDNTVIAKAGANVQYCSCRLEDGAQYIGFDTEEFYNATAGVLRNLRQSLPENGKITAIASASASGNTLLCKADGTPLISAYSWTNEAMSEEIKAVYGEVSAESIYKTAGWQFYDTFPRAHMAHLRVHAPKVLDSADICCMMTEYINFRLSGKWGIDYSSATPSYFMNQTTKKWELPEALNISAEKLPPLYESGYVLGHITEKAASETMLDIDTQVVLGSFDHPAAARSCGVLKEGQLLISCGTSWVCLIPCMNRESILERGMLCDPFLSQTGPWAGMLSLAQVAMYVDKMVTRYISDAPDRHIAFDKAAEQATDEIEINPLEDWQSDYSGYSKESIAKAIMTGTIRALKDKLDAAMPDGLVIKEAVMAGGPSQSAIWRKITEDVLGIPVKVKYGASSGAVGAAMIARHEIFK